MMRLFGLVVVPRSGLDSVMEHSTEITKEAAWAIIGNDEQSWRDFKTTELAEFSYYHSLGVNLVAITNFIGGITQYYVQDINA